MAYVTIASTDYMVRVGEGRGKRLQIEGRRRAIDGSLLVDPITTKQEVQLEITGEVNDGRFFTPGEADTLIATLAAGAVAVTGDVGSFTARARDIGWIDGQQYDTDPPTLYRWVSVTLEQV